MNIFALDNDPALAARYLCDQHLGKMLLESAQLLCNVFDEPVGAIRSRWLKMLPVERVKLDLLPYKRTHYNNRFSVWARTSSANCLWLWQHANALAIEHRTCFAKSRGSELALDWMRGRFPALPAVGRTPFAMHDRYRGPDAVQAYRAYYAAEKLTLRNKPVSWTGGDRVRPPWLPAL